jgi:glycyl-tRNA synthetase beta chain
VVARGNAKVVRARLEDARFYYEEDQKVRLESRAEELKGVVFHSKLGTSWEKVERFTALARWLAGQIAPASAEVVERAAYLCKTDLVSGMVGEFPELQGIMGSAYARLQSERPEVAKAIYEHYQPTRSGGPIPESLEGCLLSMADKMDTIAGCFGVGLIPSGTADPFALRRQTLGIIRIVLERPFKVSLGALIDEALPLLEGKLTAPKEEVKKLVLDFFEGRLHHYLVQEGIGPDVVDASLTVGIDDMVEAVKRTRSLAAFKARPDFDSLAVAFKRVVNIIKTPERRPVNLDLFKGSEEQGLYAKLQNVSGLVEASVKSSDYDGALEAMAGLKGAIDAYFDTVLIMDENLDIRKNRLALLTSIHDLFAKVADFRKIQTA